MLKYKRPLRIVAAIIAGLVLLIIFYAFAATNIVPESGAGVGSEAITGYTVTNVDYTLNTANPDTCDQVEFDINPSAAAGNPDEVWVQVVAGSSWYTCTYAANHATCPFSPPVDVSTMNTLTVSAAQ